MVNEDHSEDLESSAKHGDNFYRNNFYERLDHLNAEADVDDVAPDKEDDALINNPYLASFYRQSGLQHDQFRERIEPAQQEPRRRRKQDDQNEQQAT